MNYFFILILFFSLKLYSKNIGEFSCVEPQYGYINGILNRDVVDSENSAFLLKKTLKINKEIKTFYNQSEGIRVDLIRSIFQKVEESNKKGFIQTSVNNLMIKYARQILGDALDISDRSEENIMKWVLTDNQKQIDEKISNFYDKNKKLIIFSHSQGNLYANQACENLGKSAFENIQIATPSSEIKCGEKNHYTSIHSDEMIVLLNKIGKPIGSVLGLEIKSPLKTNVTQQNGKYIENSFPSYVTPIPFVEIYNVFKFIQSENGFQIHSIDNYLRNPPSLSRIKSHHNEILENNYSVEGKSIILSENIKITCNNIKDYLETKIEITRGPATVLDKPIKVSKQYSEKFYIEKRGDKYIVSSFDLDSWLAHKFWFLYPIGLFLALLLLGPIAKAVKDSDDRNKKE